MCLLWGQRKFHKVHYGLFINLKKHVNRFLTLSLQCAAQGLYILPLMTSLTQRQSPSLPTLCYVIYKQLISKFSGHFMRIVTWKKSLKCHQQTSAQNRKVFFNFSLPSPINSHRKYRPERVWHLNHILFFLPKWHLLELLDVFVGKILSLLVSHLAFCLT